MSSIPHRQRSAAARAILHRRRVDLRKERIAAGKCRDCAKPLAPDSKDCCPSCAAWRKSYTEAYLKEKFERGECARCKNPVHREGASVCKAHLRKRKIEKVINRIRDIELLRKFAATQPEPSEPIGVVYKIVNVQANPPSVYIGATTRDSEVRMNEHISDARQGRKRGRFGRELKSAVRRGIARDVFVVEDIRPFYSKLGGFLAEHDEIVRARKSDVRVYNRVDSAAERKLMGWVKEMNRLQAEGA